MADLLPTRKVGIPAHLGLSYLLVQLGEVIFFMLICTFKAVPGAFLFRAQNSLSPSYKKPRAIVFSIGEGTKW